ncbi:S41 family peptidase [Leuconostoc lactis]|uniref:S41 family peptidase n=2 Tax=Leuconostoc TaxID=1243 RepID=UPI00020DA0AC|nr:S41 family peptidase [Leuconostoc lactis]
MRRWLKISIGVFLMTIFAAIGLLYIYGPNFNVYLWPPSAERYGMNALDKLNKYGYFSDTDNWKSQYQNAAKEMKSVKNYNQADIVLKKVVSHAGGKHSKIVTTQETKKQQHYEDPEFRFEDSLLIIHEPQFTGNANQANNYANKINSYIFKHKHEIKGVILDLSNNNGGDMAPMILGISSLIPDGNIFSFIFPNSNTEKIILDKGSLNAGEGTVSLKNHGKINNVKIAVIINKMTASSGEFTALAIKSSSRVKFFGENSAGYTSVNQSFPLYSGTTINLTVGGVKDITNKEYFNTPITPDVRTNEPYKLASQWISSQNE